jgi:negative regulator of flagellin synthesis FlgM
MMQVNGVYGNNGLNMVRPDQRPNETGAKPAVSKPQDQVEISEAAQMLSRMQEPEIRMDKVQQVRQAIAQGTYETPEKINVAIDRILKDLGGDANH